MEEVEKPGLEEEKEEVGPNQAVSREGETERRAVTMEGWRWPF